MFEKKKNPQLIGVGGSSVNYLVALTAQLSNPLPKLPKGAVRPAPRRLSRPRGRRLAKNEITELCDSYATGHGVVELSRKYGLHRDTVNRHLTRSGIQLRSGSVLDTDSVAQIIDQYSAGDSCATIAARFGVNPATIANALKKAGTNLRPRNGRA